MGIKVVSHESIPEFERKVNELLEQGYSIISCGKNEESCWAVLRSPK